MKKSIITRDVVLIANRRCAFFQLLRGEISCKSCQERVVRSLDLPMLHSTEDDAQM